MSEPEEQESLRDLDARLEAAIDEIVEEYWAAREPKQEDE